MFNIYTIYQQPVLMIIVLLLISVWALIWKGLGLWSAARNKQKGWYLAILILNTMGLLPIIYLIWFKPKVEKKEEIVLEEPVEKELAKTTVKKTNKKVVKKPVKKKNK